MTFRAGGKIRLVGDGWDGVPVRQGDVVVLDQRYNVGHFHDTQGAPVGMFILGGEPWQVWSAPHEFGAVPIDDEPSPRGTVGQQGVGYLDGWLGLPATSGDDEYLLGYGHGQAVRGLGPKSVACPACGAQPGQPCNAPTDGSRRDVTWFHIKREDAL